MKLINTFLIAFTFSFYFSSNSNAQTLSSDFEVWDSSNVSATIFPHDWPLLEDQYCVRSTNAQQGNYALTLSVWYYYVKTNGIQSGAINFRPTSLTGYYTYTDNMINELVTGNLINDTAIASAFLTHSNSVTQQNDTIGKGQLFLYQSTAYQYFDCPITYTDTITPDSVTIVLDPSIVRRYINATTHQAPANSMGKCSFLTVDNISLISTISGIANTFNEIEISVYPNPASNRIFINTNKITDAICTIYNSEGKEIYSSTFSNKEINLDVSKMPSGIYFVAITKKNGQRIASKRFNVVR